MFLHDYVTLYWYYNVRNVYVGHSLGLKVIFLLISTIKNTFFNTKTVHILRKMYQNNHVYMTAFLATIYI